MNKICYPHKHCWDIQKEMNTDHSDCSECCLCNLSYQEVNPLTTPPADINKSPEKEPCDCDGEEYHQRQADCPIAHPQPKEPQQENWEERFEKEFLIKGSHFYDLVVRNSGTTRTFIGSKVLDFIRSEKEKSYEEGVKKQPMGVSQWKEIGKKYGYWEFFAEEERKLCEFAIKNYCADHTDCFKEIEKAKELGAKAVKDVLSLLKTNENK